VLRFTLVCKRCPGVAAGWFWHDLFWQSIGISREERGSEEVFRTFGCGDDSGRRQVAGKVEG